MPSLFVIRHGFRLDHENRNWGKTADRPFDSPLAQKGEQQALATAAWLRQNSPYIGAIYSSPLLRAIQTAHPLAHQLQRPLFIEHGLIEWLNPKWYDFSAGPIPENQLYTHFPQIDLGYRSLVRPRYPEPTADICAERCAYVVRHLTETQPEYDLVLFTHGFCVQSIASKLTDGRGKANEQTCAINKFARSGTEWKLVETQTNHLHPHWQEQQIEWV